MTTETTSSNPSTPSLGIPIAIVLAGGLIALAIYFGGQRAPQPIGTGGQPTTSSTPTPEVTFKPISDADHIRGPANARVTVIEYSDLECPYCKNFHPIMQQLLAAYPNDVRWVYRHYPIHNQAPAEAVAAECAGAQGKFWEFIDKVYEVTPSNDGLDLKTLPQLAQQVGVSNISEFTSCLNSDKYRQVITDDAQDAQSAGATGTPYSIVLGPNGQKVPVLGQQTLVYLKGVVDKMLQS